VMPGCARVVVHGCARVVMPGCARVVVHGCARVVMPGCARVVMHGFTRVVMQSWPDPLVKTGCAICFCISKVNQCNRAFLSMRLHTLFVGSSRTTYIRCIYGIFGKEITEFTFRYSIYTVLANHI